MYLYYESFKPLLCFFLHPIFAHYVNYYLFICLFNEFCLMHVLPLFREGCFCGIGSLVPSVTWDCGRNLENFFS